LDIGSSNRQVAAINEATHVLYEAARHAGSTELRDALYAEASTAADTAVEIARSSHSHTHTAIVAFKNAILFTLWNGHGKLGDPEEAWALAKEMGGPGRPIENFIGQLLHHRK